jgi:hypothetical protein
MINFSQIYEGWRNKIVPPSELKDLIEETAQQRLAICAQCPHHSKNHKSVRPDAHCVNCGCTLSAKTRCLSCACPLSKWLPVISGEMEEEIRKEIPINQEIQQANIITNGEQQSGQGPSEA